MYPFFLSPFSDINFPPMCSTCNTPPSCCPEIGQKNLEACYQRRDVYPGQLCFLQSTYPLVIFFFHVWFFNSVLFPTVCTLDWHACETLHLRRLLEMFARFCSGLFFVCFLSHFWCVSFATPFRYFCPSAVLLFYIFLLLLPSFFWFF